MHLVLITAQSVLQALTHNNYEVETTIIPTLQVSKQRG